MPPKIVRHPYRKVSQMLRRVMWSAHCNQAPSARSVSTQRSMHPSQIRASGAEIIFRTRTALFPQKEHFGFSPPESTISAPNVLRLSGRRPPPLGLDELVARRSAPSAG